MSGINVGNLYRKRTVRKLSGEIIDLTDETNGGAIISKGRVVNQERLDELAKIEADKKEAALAVTKQVTNTQAPLADRTAAPSKIETLEKRINDQDKKLDAILAALKK